MTAFDSPYKKMPLAELQRQGGHAYEDVLARSCDMSAAEVRAHLAPRVAAGELTRCDLASGCYYMDNRETSAGRR